MLPSCCIDAENQKSKLRGYLFTTYAKSEARKGDMNNRKGVDH